MYTIYKSDKESGRYPVPRIHYVESKSPRLYLTWRGCDERTISLRRVAFLLTVNQIISLEYEERKDKYNVMSSN